MPSTARKTDHDTETLQPRAGAATSRRRQSREAARPAMTSSVSLPMLYAALLVSLAMPLVLKPFVAAPAALVAHRSQRGGPPAWMRSHYRYLLRTVWIGLFAYATAFVFSILGIGLFLFPLVAVWGVARCVNGLIHAARVQPVPDPDALIV